MMRPWAISLLQAAVMGLAIVRMAPSTVGEEPWEYAPYEIAVWLAVDPELDLDQAAVDRISQDMKQHLEVALGPTANIAITPPPMDCQTQILRRLETLGKSDLEGWPFALVLSKSLSEEKTLRSLESAAVKVQAVDFDPLAYRYLHAKREVMASGSEAWKQLVDRWSPKPEALPDIISRLQNGSEGSAILPVRALPPEASSLRAIPLRLPWQLPSLMRKADKLFLVRLSSRSRAIGVDVRELDTATEMLGVCFPMEPTVLTRVGHLASTGILRAFRPLARIEENDPKTCKILVRASGLLMNPEGHPTSIQPGDVLQPIIRRDDRVGNAEQIQSLPWTYYAVTGGTHVLRHAQSITGLRGGALVRSSRRVRRLAILVQAKEPRTELHLVGKTKDALPAPGIAVYRRDPGEDAFRLIGRSDWRGILSLQELDLPTIPLVHPKSLSETEPSDESGQPESIQLRLPIHLFYVRSGDTVLAKLPVVIGQESRIQVPLPDDTRRLEAEALVRGVQGEIIDLIARRQILISRIQTKIDGGQTEEAQKLFKELKSLPRYEEMSGKLEKTQREVLAPDKGPVPQAAQRRIDDMFNETRKMLQKHVVDSAIVEVEKKLP